MLLVLVAPALALDKSYNGSVDPTTEGWTVWEGVLQGSVFNEGGGNFSWFMNDATDKKTKMRIGTGVNTNPDVGGYVESRMRCTSYGGSSTGTPLNLGIQVYYQYPGPSTYRRGHWVTIKPDQLTMNTQMCKPTTYAGAFNSYHTIRLCYKRLLLSTRGSRMDSWAVYVDGATIPVVHSYTSPDNAAKDWGGPTWGAGNTGDTQDLYFDWVNYTDTGAYPPGMDGTVQFTNGDPDGTGAADGQSFTITWQTNVPTTGELRYSVDGDNSFSGVAYDSQNPSLTTNHSVTVTGVTPGATYEYIAISTDAGAKKAVSLPATVAVPNPFFISAGPAVAVAPDGLSATITWSTNLPDLASEVHWGLDSNCSTTTVEPGSGGLTDHSVTIPTQPATKFYYYAKSTHATWPATQSTVRSFSVLGETLINPGFEDGVLDPWVKVNPFGGIMSNLQWAVPAHSGSKWAGSVASYGTMNHGHLYQKVKCTPGSFYEAKAWIWTRRQADPSHELDVACAIGIDPYGGTSADSPNIVWSGWRETANSQTDGDTGPGGPWTQIGVGVKAKSSEATVFLIQQHNWPITWNISGFDDASWAVAPPPPDNIAATRRLPDGYPAQLHGKVVTGAFMDPDSLEQFFYIEEADRSAGIRVKWAGSASAGQLVDVSGDVQTINGEKTIIADEVGPETPPIGDIPAPFAVNGKTIVQGFGYQAPATQGLRVKAWGRVIYADSTGVYIDDGTNYVDDTTFFLGEPVKGIRVYYPDAEVPWGGYVQVTGIPSVVLYADNSANPPVSRTIPVIWATEISTISE